MFDGFALLARLDVAGGPRPSVTQRQRFLESAAWAAVRDTGDMAFSEFGTPLPLARGVAALARGALGLGPAFTDNASVTVRPGRAGELVAATESVAGLWRVDAATLATLGPAAAADGVPGALTTAHPHTRSDGTLVNFATGVGGRTTVFVQDAATAARAPVAALPLRLPPAPCWMHAFPATDEWCVLPEQPVPMDLKAALLGGGDHAMFGWRPDLGTRYTLVRLPPVAGAGPSSAAAAAAPPAVFESPEPIFYFHTVNAFCTATEFVFDVPRFPDPTMINRLSLDNQRAAPGEAAPVERSTLTRVALPLSGNGPVSLTRLCADGSEPYFFEFPAVNPLWKGRSEYRFAWGIAATPPAAAGDSLVKVTLRGTAPPAMWREAGCLTGEPVVVPRPGGAAEDDAVVLSIVTSAAGPSFLLVLDAASMRELARAPLAAGLPYGFHGLWVEGGGKE
jgi:carlactone synthase/all-trans-10'-apo-beta-carotenal 13,14-cleaving dioxygenase